MKRHKQNQSMNMAMKNTTWL